MSPVAPPGLPPLLPGHAGWSWDRMALLSLGKVCGTVPSRRGRRRGALDSGIAPHPRPSQHGKGVGRPSAWPGASAKDTGSPSAPPASSHPARARPGSTPAGTTNSLRPPGSGPSPCPVPALTFPLGPSGSRQVAKMCWGGWGLAASCLTSSSPMPRLEPVTRTLRASADISAASAPGGDTQRDCHLLGVKRSWAQPRVWLWAPMGMGTVPAPALAPRLPWSEPGSGVDQGLHSI